MNSKKNYKVKIVLEIPFESSVVASNSEEAISMVLDNAMEYLEANTSDSRRFDTFWEYYIDYKILSLETD